MKYFVYYHDDYDEMGGKGLEAFQSQELALNFIRERLKNCEKPDIANYNLFRAHELKLEAYERVLDIRIVGPH